MGVITGLCQRIAVAAGAGKGSDLVVILPYSSIVASLEDYRKMYPSDDWVFAGQYKGEALSVGPVQVVMRNAVVNAGLEKKASVHTLRNSFATLSLGNGVDLRYKLSMPGHSNSKTTGIYTHITTKGSDQIKNPSDNLDI